VSRGNCISGFFRNVWLVVAASLVMLTMTATPAAEQDSGPIRVGITVSLTGEYEAPGKDELAGAQMWASDVNGRGALLGRKVEIVYYDDKSDAATSARLYERLINEDKVDLLLGPYSSELTLEASTVAEKHSFPMVATGAADGHIWARGYKNIFGIDAPAREYMKLLVDSAAGAGLKRIALIYADSDFPRNVADGVRDLAASNNMEVVFDRKYNQDTTDFSAMLQQMKASTPDLVVGGTYLDDSIAIMRAAKQVQLSPRAIVFTVGPSLKEFGNVLGSDADGVLGVVSWIRSARLPMARDFAYRYKQKHGHNPGAHVAYGYGGGQVLEAAVRLAGTLDKDAVRQQLVDMKFRSLLGHYNVEETGKQVGKSIFVLQWQNGRRLLVLPKLMRESPIEYPFKPWSER
jgi:branched-chain amino acid transport system substrate-binding protein